MGGPQEGPRRPQEGPWRAQRPQEGPSTAQEEPKTAPTVFKTIAKKAQRGAQEACTGPPSLGEAFVP
eukprot:1007660-Pyramimonas_sp.AAC.1